MTATPPPPPHPPSYAHARIHTHTILQLGVHSLACHPCNELCCSIFITHQTHLVVFRMMLLQPRSIAELSPAELIPRCRWVGEQKGIIKKALRQQLVTMSWPCMHTVLCNVLNLLATILHDCSLHIHSCHLWVIALCLPGLVSTKADLLMHRKHLLSSNTLVH